MFRGVKMGRVCIADADFAASDIHENKTIAKLLCAGFETVT
jgi:hypothetical protein